MKVLLLGVGMQGKAALHDLVTSDAVSEVIAADRDVRMLESFVAERGYGHRVRAESLNASDRASVDRLMRLGPDVAIDVLPATHCGSVAASAVAHGVHLVNTLYLRPGIAAVGEEAVAKGVTILPEFGMDPGIDLVLLGEAVRSFDTVVRVSSYGAGFPEWKAADNPIRYKVTWTFEGVLRSYRRAARVVKHGRVVEILGTDVFSPVNTHELGIEGVGILEAFPNGDAARYARAVALDVSALESMGRYALRWPGHCAFWKALVDLHLLDDDPVIVDGVSVDRRRFLAAAIEPHIRLGSDERDVVVVRVDVAGTRDGRDARVVKQVIDTRDLQTGLTAMSRAVGFTASIGAQLIGNGLITKRGLLSPATDVPYEPFVSELGARGLEVTSC